MIDKELVEQWYSLSKDSYEFAQRAAAHGAAQREKELMVVGMEPKQYIGVDDEPDFSYYTATKLAAARLQGAEELKRLQDINRAHVDAHNRLVIQSARDGERITNLERLLEALEGVMYWDNGKSEWDDARTAIAAAEQESGK